MPALIDTPEITRSDERSKPSQPKTKILPPYAVIIYNDNEHTFPYVIETLGKVFGYSLQKSFNLAKEIHSNGRYVVWTGSKELAELKQEQIQGAGPDFHSPTPVLFPLKSTIEPMP